MPNRRFTACLLVRTMLAVACVCAAAHETTAQRDATSPPTPAGRPEIYLQIGHYNAMGRVAYSPDGRHAVSVGVAGAWLWEIETGREVRHLVHPSAWEAAFSPDGRFLATSSMDQSVWVWDLAGQKETMRITWTVAQPATPKKGVSVAWSPDGRSLLTTARDGTARLWDTSSWREVRRFEGHHTKITSVAFSPDGRFVLSTGDDPDNSARMWDVATSAQVMHFVGHSGPVYSAAFSPDGRFVMTGSGDGTARLWDTTTGKSVREFPTPAGSIAWLPDGRHVVTGATSTGVSQLPLLRPLQLWDVVTGKEIERFPPFLGEVRSVACSPDGKQLLTLQFDGRWKNPAYLPRKQRAELEQMLGALDPATRKSIEAFKPGRTQYPICVWNVTTGALDRSIEGHSVPATFTALSPDGKRLLTSFDDALNLGKTPLLGQWDLATGAHVRRFASGVGQGVFAVSPDGRSVLAFDAHYILRTLTGPWYSTMLVRMLDPHTGAEIRRFERHTAPVVSAAFSSDGRQVVTGSYDKTVRLWDAATGAQLRRFEIDGPVGFVAFSADGKSLVIATIVDSAPNKPVIPFGPRKTIVRVLDMETGSEIRRFEADDQVVAASLSPDGRTLVGALTGSYLEATVHFWDVTTGNAIAPALKIEGNRTEAVVGRGLPSIAFSHDNQTVFLGTPDGTVIVWDRATSKERRRFKIESVTLNWLLVTPDDRFLIATTSDGTIRFLDTATGREVARLVSFADGTWAVVDPDGRFDASNGGHVEGLHFVVGMESIGLDQLKDRYYEPGLLARLLGNNTEPLRDVSPFQNVRLFPKVELFAPTSGSTRATVTLTNRGGGIGPVRVFLNGKERVADARSARADPNAPKLSLTVDLAGAPVTPGQPNTIRVVAFNAEGYLASRPVEATWTPRGTPQAEPPELYAIVAGVSAYSAPDGRIDLKFAAKDARDVAGALQLGARRLFGAGRVHLTLLSSGGPDAPTKANLRRAFEAARKARPQDVLVVYLAGHGVTAEGSADTYCYLTQEARGTRLTDPGLREAWAVTSEELVEWIKQVPAGKQVMVLDTCAAGAAAARLVEKRSVSGDQIRAIERLKDRTGFHILMGSASDAASYEASQYGQGLLTYALLQGMRGAALREEEFVDVSRLFNYAADQVPQLARNVGGVQRPVIAAPRGTSFDIGQLRGEDRTAIPLASVMPMLLRPRLVDDDVGDDTLGLIRELRRQLREAGYTGARGSAAVVFVDEEELPGAIRPAGKYTIEGDVVRVRLVLRRDERTVAEADVQGSKADLPGLVDRLVEAILREVAALPTLP